MNSATNQPPEITGLKKLNLDQGGEAYLRECVAKDQTWFVTRARESSYGTPPRRAIQASGRSRESVIRTFNGWRGYRPALVEVRDGKVVWHTNEEKS